MRHIKHEKDCFSRISKHQEVGWENKARLICIFVQLTWNSRILSGQIHVIESLLFKTYVVPGLQRWEIKWEWGLSTRLSQILMAIIFLLLSMSSLQLEMLWYFVPDIKKERTWRNREQNWEKKQFVSWLKSWIQLQINCLVFIYVVTCRFNFAELAFPKASVVQASSWLLWCS